MQLRMWLVLGYGGADGGAGAGGELEGGAGHETIGATQTSNSEHQCTFYGIRVPNLMPPRK